MQSSPTCWREVLAAFATGSGPLRPEFLEQCGAQLWCPTAEDRKAAGEFYIQLVSRITTQRLDYLDGSDKAALDSVYKLFGFAREIGMHHPEARHFNTVVWEILNGRVRPFTAKWHSHVLRGGLTALDETDEFRAELDRLRPHLVGLTDLLVGLRDERSFPWALPSLLTAPLATSAQIQQEMRRDVPWGIPQTFGGLESGHAQLNEAERKAIAARRGHYFPDIPEASRPKHAVGLALSGGGIRSATFSLGVLVALARRNILPQIDYLSTVSGGGYVGSFLSSFLHGKEVLNDTPVGLRSTELPFRRDNGESEPLRHLRHHSKYLATGTVASKFTLVCAQVYGTVVNLFGLIVVVALLAWLEHGLRAYVVEAGIRGAAGIHWTWLQVFPGAVIFLAASVVAGMIWQRYRSPKRGADWLVAIFALVVLLLLLWKGLDIAHRQFGKLFEPTIRREGSATERWVNVWYALLAAIPVLASAAGGWLGRLNSLARKALGWLATLGAIALLMAIFLGAYQISGRWPGATTLGLLGLALAYWLVVDVNFTSPHRHYRRKLAEAYLLSPSDTGIAKDAAIKLEQLAEPKLGPYHLINCALNVPASKNPRMQGRRTDFFLFSGAYCGSPLTGYRETSEWEKMDQNLNLGTAMAISGAAAAPQMGLGTKERLRFWLAVLNVRLGYWARVPNLTAKGIQRGPGLAHFLTEVFGWMAEKGPWLYLSDGGHIENLGVYELLRRRCKYIVAIDGEQDPKMTFHALTTLQRMAQIDMDVKIDVNLDDLRVNEGGLSRSHFRFCRIHYPNTVEEGTACCGYLLYVKLSLTGNEGEFLRRYRLDEPVFPHHSTANQFFTESQYEAYRALGEHVGDKLFLEAIIGKLAHAENVDVETWFRALGEALLEPVRSA